jgi:NAD(P)-dependent dehydrogenase (short-subunit alcohol dehydrogenase family)
LNTLLVTGANRGLGLEFARSFAADGWRVHACCRIPERAKDLAKVDGDVAVHRLDVTDGLRVASLARELADEPIDVLINNAGVLHENNSLGGIDYDDWVDELKVNTIAPVRMAERFLEQVAASELKLIVNMTSGMASIADTASSRSIVYRSSKAALNMATKCLALEYAGRGVTVVALSPGWVATDMGGPNAELSPEESVAKMRRFLARVSPAESGGFFNPDGVARPW